MIFSHKCNQMMKRIIGKKGKVVIDQLKFTCLDDEEEDENDEQLETWVCTDRSCEAIILYIIITLTTVTLVNLA